MQTVSLYRFLFYSTLILLAGFPTYADSNPNRPAPQSNAVISAINEGLGWLKQLDKNVKEAREAAKKAEEAREKAQKENDPSVEEKKKTAEEKKKTSEDLEKDHKQLGEGLKGAKEAADRVREAAPTEEPTETKYPDKQGNTVTQRVNSEGTVTDRSYKDQNGNWVQQSFKEGKPEGVWHVTDKNGNQFTYGYLDRSGNPNAGLAESAAKAGTTQNSGQPVSVYDHKMNAWATRNPDGSFTFDPKYSETARTALGNTVQKQIESRPPSHPNVTPKNMGEAVGQSLRNGEAQLRLTPKGPEYSLKPANTQVTGSGTGPLGRVHTRTVSLSGARVTQGLQNFAASNGSAAGPLNKVQFAPQGGASRIVLPPISSQMLLGSFGRLFQAPQGRGIGADPSSASSIPSPLIEEVTDLSQMDHIPPHKFNEPATR